MSLLKIAIVSAITYGLYRYVTSGRTANVSAPRAAFADGEATHAHVQVRNAGPEAMASSPSHWDSTDQASDESYPASDSPSSNRFT